MTYQDLMANALAEHHHHWYVRALEQNMADRLWQAEVEDPFR